MNYEKALKDIRWEAILHYSSMHNLESSTISYLMREYFLGKENDVVYFFRNICSYYLSDTVNDKYNKLVKFKKLELSDAEVTFFDCAEEILTMENNLSDYVKEMKNRSQYMCLQSLIGGYSPETILKEQEHMVTYNDTYLLNDKDLLLEKFLSVKRSDGYMEKRWKYALSMLRFGYIDDNSFKIFTRNLSKKFRGASHQVCRDIIQTIRKILKKDDLSPYRFSREDFESLEYSYKMICFHTIKDLDFWDQRHFFHHTMTLADAPYLIPLANSFRDKEAMFNAIDRLRREAEQNKDRK